jgi:hydroxyethylthiazole kinase
MEKYTGILASVREKSPLIHQITNYVTVNDCANVTICIGASPVMSHAVEDVADMEKIASALVLNIGTLDPAQIDGMLAAGRAAAERGIPIILDPVGAGATPYRTETAELLLRELPITVVKGNAGEIGTIAGVAASVRGVDSGDVSGDKKTIVKTLAKQLGCTVVMSGAEDIVSDGKRVAGILNGVPYMGQVSGTGCMASAAIGACTAVSGNIMDGCITAMAALGIAGETAAKTAKGPGTFRPAFFDAVAHLTGEQFAGAAKITEW